MAEAWSVYIVPKRPWPDLLRAAQALVKGWGDDDARFGVAPFDAEHLVFQVEHHNGRYRTVAGWEDSGLVVHEALGGRVTELHGTSNTDSVGVTAYDRGRRVDGHDTYRSALRRLKRFRIDLEEAESYGGFGVSPSRMVDDWVLPLHGDPPDAMAELAFEVMLAQHTDATDAVAERLQQALADGHMEAVAVADALARLGQLERARGALKAAPVDTPSQREAVFRRCLARGWAGDLAAWADDAAALSLPQRVELLTALGRDEASQALALEGDRQQVATYLEQALGRRPPRWRDDPRKPMRSLVGRAAAARRAQQALEPLPDGIIEDLMATGLPPLTALAAELEQTAQAIEADPVPFLRRLVQETTDAPARRAFLGRLALALDARDADDALPMLEQAHRAYVRDPAQRARIAAALERRRGAPDDEGAADLSGLPAHTPEAIARYEALVPRLMENPPSPDREAQLAHARFQAGYPDAGQALEDAYIALSHASPMRARLEEALTALGLF